MTDALAQDLRSCRWVPWGIAGGFALLAGMLGAMTYLAVHGFPGVWTERAYEKGLAYNEALKAVAEQNALGWRGELTATYGRDRRIAVDFTLKDMRKNPVSGAQAKLWFVRPASAGLDRQATLLPHENGHYRAEERLPASGVWDLRVSAVYEGHNYQLAKRVTVP